jgi:hypothetical protein
MCQSCGVRSSGRGGFSFFERKRAGGRVEYFDVEVAEVAECDSGGEAGAVEKGGPIGDSVNGEADVPALWQRSTYWEIEQHWRR